MNEVLKQIGEIGISEIARISLNNNNGGGGKERDTRYLRVFRFLRSVLTLHSFSILLKVL